MVKLVPRTAIAVSDFDEIENEIQNFFVFCSVDGASQSVDEISFDLIHCCFSKVRNWNRVAPQERNETTGKDAELN